MPSGKNAQHRAESSKGGPATSQAAAKSAPASKWESTGGDEEVLCMSAEELKAAAAEALREFAKALKERGALCPDDVLAALVHRAALTGVDEKALVVAVDAVSLPADFRQTVLLTMRTAFEAVHDANRSRAEKAVAVAVASEPCEFVRVEEAVDRARAAGVDEEILRRALQDAAESGAAAVRELLGKALRLDTFDPTPIMDALRAEKGATAAHAAEALCAVAVDPPKRLKMKKSGALTNLLQLLADGSREAKQHAAAAVRAMSVDADSEDELVRGGVIAHLVASLGGTHGGGREQAARCLGAFAVRHHSQIADFRIETAPGMPAADAMKLLVAMLEEGGASSGSCMSGREAAAEAITRLVELAPTVSRRVALSAAAVEYSAVPSLVSMLTLDSWDGAESKAVVLRGRGNAATTLHALTRDTTGRRAMVEAGAFPLLVDMMKDYEQLEAERVQMRRRADEEAEKKKKQEDAAELSGASAAQGLSNGDGLAQVEETNAVTLEKLTVAASSPITSGQSERKKTGAISKAGERLSLDSSDKVRDDDRNGLDGDKQGMPPAHGSEKPKGKDQNEQEDQRTLAQIEREQAVAARVAAAKAAVEARKAEEEAAKMAAEGAVARREREAREEWERIEAERNALEVAVREEEQKRIEARLCALGKEQAAATLRNLALDPGNDKLIAAAGALDLLVAMLDSSIVSDSEETQDGVLNTGKAADVGERTTPVASAAGAIDELTCLDQPTSVGGAAQAAGCLSNLVLNNSRIRRAVVALGAIPRLATLLSDTEHARHFGVAVTISAAAALCNVTKGGQSVNGRIKTSTGTLAASKILNDSAIPILVQLLAGSSSTGAAYAAGSLSNLADHLASAIITAGAIEPLVAMLRRDRHSSSGGAGKVLAELGRCNAAAALANLALANVAANGAEIRRAGAMQVLVRQMYEGSRLEAEHAANALAVLVEDPESAMLAMGCVPPLVSLLKNGSSSGKVAASSALNKLARHKENRVELISEGALGPLVALVIAILSGKKHDGQGTTGTDGTHGAGKGSKHDVGGGVRSKRFSFSFDGDGTINHTEDSHIADVTDGRARGEANDDDDATDASSTPERQSAGAAAATLRHLALNANSHGEIRLQGGIPPLVELLAQGDVTEQKEAAGALRNLAVDVDNGAEMVSVGAIEIFVRRLRHTFPVADRGVAAAVLEALALDDSVRPDATKNDSTQVSAPPESILSPSSALYFREKLRNLSRKTRKLSHDECMTRIEKTATRHAVRHSHDECTTRSVRDNRSFRAQMRALGAVPLLEALARCGDVEAERAARGAIKHVQAWFH